MHSNIDHHVARANEPQERLRECVLVNAVTFDLLANRFALDQRKIAKMKSSAAPQRAGGTAKKAAPAQLVGDKSSGIDEWLLPGLGQFVALTASKTFQQLSARHYLERFHQRSTCETGPGQGRHPSFMSSSS